MLDASIAGHPGDASQERQQMAHLRAADRAFQPTATFPTTIVARVAAAVLAIAATVAAVGPFGVLAPTDQGTSFSPHVIRSGMQWEIQRQLQSGDPDPLTESGREWERQRRQQSAAY
jgi:hypothetical protein